MYEHRDSWDAVAGSGSSPVDIRASMGKQLVEGRTVDDELDDRRGGDVANGRDLSSGGEGSIVDDAHTVSDESVSAQAQQTGKTAAAVVPEYNEMLVCDGLDGLGSSAELETAMEWPTAPIRDRIGLHDPKRIQDMQQMPTTDGGRDSVLKAMDRPSYRAGFGVGGKVATQRAAWRAEALAQAEVAQHSQQWWLQTSVFGGAVAMVAVVMRRRK